MSSFKLSHLEELESEAVFIIREVAAQFERPVLLFSGGKDSIVMTHLAMKAFAPAKLPFPLLHIDTGHNFPETLVFRDKLVNDYGLQLLVGSVEQSIEEGRVEDETGTNASRIVLQTVTLLDVMSRNKFDVALGGGRRDEEKSRAKERIFSHRDAFGQWEPRNQRPELWNIFNGRKKTDEHFRVFPLSNWTELDIWHYVQQQQIQMPSLYFAHMRSCVRRDGVLLAKSAFLNPHKDDIEETFMLRFRTIGDMTCTGATPSMASNVQEVIQELTSSHYSERGGRFDDMRSETSMEDRKKEGYF